MQWNSARAGLESKLRLIDLAVLRVVVPVAIYVFISLWISLVTLAFRVDFTQWYGKGGFPLFWLSNFMTMWAVRPFPCSPPFYAVETNVRTAAWHAHGSRLEFPRPQVHRLLVSPLPLAREAPSALTVLYDES